MGTGTGTVATTRRLVLDTNVLLSALVFSTESFIWLCDSWKSGDILPLLRGDTRDELRRVLSYSRFGLSADERNGLLEEYLPWCEMVDVVEPPEVPDCRDPSDRPFLELALADQADALVTGDSDPLALAPVFSVPILTPNGLQECCSHSPGWTCDISQTAS